MLMNKDLLSLAFTVRKWIAASVLAKVMMLAAIIVQFVVIANAIEVLYLERWSALVLTRTVVIVLVAVVFKFALNIIENEVAFRAASLVKTNLRSKVYEKLLELEMGFQARTKTGAITSTAVDGIEALDVYFSRYLPQLIYSLLAPLILFAYLATVYFPSALALLLTIPLIPLSMIAVAKLAKKRMGAFWSSYTGLTDYFLQSLQGLLTLKIFKRDKERAEKLREKAWLFRSTTMKVLRIQLVSIFIMNLLTFGGAALGITLAMTGLTRGEVSIAGAVIVLLLALQFFIPTLTLGSYFHAGMNGVAAAEEIFELLNAPMQLKAPTSKTNSGNLSVPNENLLGNKTICFENVNFAYEADRPVLKNISLSIKPGSTVALVGQSGSGKSTIAYLLLRLYDPGDGKVTIDGRALSSYPLALLRKQMIVIFQRSYIFAGSIADNLLLAKPEASRSEMLDVLKVAGLSDFIASLPEGLDAEVGEWGNKLSAGQRQRLAIARAVLHDAAVYIFDEATANVDVESENQIWQAINHIAKHKTCIIISHRLSAVRFADKIIVLDDGKICEEGTDAQLMKKTGLYYQLFAEQQALENYGKAAGGGL